MRDSPVDRVTWRCSAWPLHCVVAFFLFQAPTLLLHLVGRLPGFRMITSPIRPMACCPTPSAMSAPRLRAEYPPASNRLLARRFRRRRYPRRSTDRDGGTPSHVEMLVDGFRGERPGRIGEERSTFLRPATLMIRGRAAAGPPSVWKAWIVRPLNAAMVSSTKPDSFKVSCVDHHLHVVVVGDR